MPDGIVIIDKPSGWTSMDVCAKLRGVFHEKRVGHAGTLDPMATGVLPVFVGQATKAVTFAEDGKKEYLARLRLGVVTDTQDTAGTVLRTSPSVGVTEDVLRGALPRFLGEREQIPPMYSAVKIQGRKLYELARRGVEVERKPRRITIYELELLEPDTNGDWGLRVLCSKGVYIRTLCHELGATLGCGGCMSALRRIRASGYTLADAVTLEDAVARGAALLQSTDSLFRRYPAYRITDAEAERRCRCGNALKAPRAAGGIYRVYGADGTFLALSRCENGVMTSIKNFFST